LLLSFLILYFASLLINTKKKAMYLTKEEFSAMPSGTKATKVKTYTGEGQLVNVERILDTCDDEYDEDLRDAKEVASGYFTETWKITRK